MKACIWWQDVSALGGGTGGQGTEGTVRFRNSIVIDPCTLWVGLLVVAVGYSVPRY